MISVKDIKSLPHHSIYVMLFKLVGLTSTNDYFLRKRDIESSETRAKPLVRSQGAKPLEAGYVSINQFICEMKIQCVSLFPLKASEKVK